MEHGNSSHLTSFFKIFSKLSSRLFSDKIEIFSNQSQDYEVIEMISIVGAQYCQQSKEIKIIEYPFSDPSCFGSHV